MLKDFRSDVLGLVPVTHTSHNERVDAFEVSLVQFAEAPRIFLGGLDQQPFLIHYLYKRRRESKSHGSKIKTSIGSLRWYSSVHYCTIPIMKTISFTEFRNKASSLVDLVEKGEEVEILRHGKVVARLVPAVSRRESAWKKPGLK